jgi:hypothetical protein
VSAYGVAARPIQADQILFVLLKFLKSAQRPKCGMLCM